MIAVNALWGLSFPIAKALGLQITEHFDLPGNETGLIFLAGTSAWIIGVRFLLAMILLLVFCRPLVASVRWPHFFSGAAIGVMFFLGLLLQVAGLASIPASRSGFLTSLVVVWTPVFATLWQRRLPRRKTVIGAAVSVLGVSVLTGVLTWDGGRIAVADDALSQWQLGDSLTSMAVLFFSLQIIMVDSLGKRFESTAFTPSMFATTALLSFAVFGGLQWTAPIAVLDSVGSSHEWWSMTLALRFIIPLLVLSLFSTLIAFFWMNRYQPVLTAGQAAVIYTLEPLFASTWAIFLPAWLSHFGEIRYENEVLSWQLIVGGTILIIANGLALWPDRKRGGRAAQDTSFP